MDVGLFWIKWVDRMNKGGKRWEGISYVWKRVSDFVDYSLGWRYILICIYVYMSGSGRWSWNVG